MSKQQGSWIERLSLVTGERIVVMPPGIASVFLTPSWSLDGTRFVVVAADSEPLRGDIYAGTVPLAESPPSVKQLTFSDR